VSTTSQRPVIRSLLETDLYKFTMQQPMLHSMPTNQAEYRFVCRNTPEFPLAELAAEVNEQLDALCTLRFTEDELAYLAALRYIRSDYIDFLRLFQFQRRFITVSTDGHTLHIVAKGPQVHVIGFEIYVLAIVNELYFRRLTKARGGVDSFLVEARKRLQSKIALLRNQEGAVVLRHPFEFFDFGVRRRFSGEWQYEMVQTLAREVPQYFKGTSNVLLAMECNLVPIGTMAHEYLQSFQALPGVQLKYFQKKALETWVQEYRGDLGTALTDVVGMDAFLADFDLFFAKLFDGLRHDSGDPVVWGEKALAHYAKLKLNANTKRLVFSDGLDVPTALSLHAHFANRVQTGFGIGTNLTNDTGLRPLNIVMKLVTCNDQPTAKLSDSPGKTMCDDETFLAYLRQIFQKTE
jgi:nicotinate phosphoribosyltransferase